MEKNARTECAIVGAGMAGLIAARRLQEANVSVIVVDKGRGVGGRMSSRRMSADGIARADHGAQCITAETSAFQTLVDQWISAGVLAVWTDRFQGQNGRPRTYYRGQTGMSAVPKLLAEDLDVWTNHQVTQVAIDDDRWRLEFDEGHTLTADSVIMTPPVPQTLALLYAGHLPLHPQTKKALHRIRYASCFAVMVELDEPSAVPAPGGVRLYNNQPIAWIADNQQKHISERPTVTIHARTNWSEKHFEADREWVGHHLLLTAEAQGWLQRSSVRQMQVQRRRYAQPIIGRGRPWPAMLSDPATCKVRHYPARSWRTPTRYDMPIPLNPKIASTSEYPYKSAILDRK